MAVKSLYFKDAAPTGSSASLSLQDGGTAPTGALTTTGWTVAKIATANMSPMVAHQKQVSGSFTTSDRLTSIQSQPGALWRSENPFTGTFANTNWTLAFRVRCSVASSQTGRVKLRLWKTTAADVTTNPPVELTSAVQVGTTTAALSTTVSATSTVTFTPGAAITLNNEYLWVHCEWEIIVASGNTSGDVVFYVESAGVITTPDFVVTTANAWSALDKSANITLSNSDKTATVTTALSGGVRSTQKRTNGTAGKYYVEFVLDNPTSVRVGIHEASATITSAFQGTYYTASTGVIAVLGSAGSVDLGPAAVAGDVIGMAWDTGAERIWFRSNGGLWNADAAADPATGTNGIDVSAIPNTDHALWGQSSQISAFTLRTQLAELSSTSGLSGFTSWMGEALPTGPSVTTLTAAAGSYTLTGTTAALALGHVAASGAYALTGSDANFTIASAPTTFPANAGAYTLTGSNAALTLGHAAAAGSYAITGSSAALRLGFVAAAGSYTLTGSAVALALGYVAGAGAYTLTGFASGFAFKYASGVGSYTLTGFDSAFAFKQTAGVSAYTLTGADAAFTTTGPILFPAAAGSYTLTGSSAALALGHTAGAGSYSLSGTAAAYRITLTAAAGSYTLTGSPAGFLAPFKLPAGADAYTLTGSDAALTVISGIVLFCGSGSYTLTGFDAALPQPGVPIEPPPVEPPAYGYVGRPSGAGRGRMIRRREREREELGIEERALHPVDLPPPPLGPSPPDLKPPPLGLMADLPPPKQHRLPAHIDEDEDEIALLLELIS